MYEYTEWVLSKSMFIFLGSHSVFSAVQRLLAWETRSALGCRLLAARLKPFPPDMLLCVILSVESLSPCGVSVFPITRNRHGLFLDEAVGELCMRWENLVDVKMQPQNKYGAPLTDIEMW